MGIRRTSVPTIAALALAMTAARAVADEYYVDPTTGNDAHSGTSPGEAWRHVSYALATVPNGQHTVHLAPGIYSAQGGETWPLPIRSGIAVVGDAGSEATLLRGGWFQASGEVPEYALVARGLTLLRGETGVHVFLYHGYNVSLELTDVRILEMTGDGILADGYDPGEGYGGYCDATLEHVVVARCQGAGIKVSGSGAYGGSAGAQLVATDCTVVDCGGLGIYTGAFGDDCCADAETTLRRCRIAGNGGDGILAWAWPEYPFSYNDLTLEDSLVAANGEDGVDSRSLTEIRRSTLVDNGLFGLRGGGVVASSILAGNREQLSPGAHIVEFCCVEGPSPPSGPGNIADDPLFVAAGSGDYRLRFDSPCVDAADPTDDGATDLLGLPRPIDGDLDALERADMGAHEHAPLFARGPARIGESLVLELWGPAGGTALLYWRRGPLEPPVPTPFGEWELGAPRLLLAAGSTAPGSPGTVVIPIPDAPELIGEAFSFQALSTSGTAGFPPMAFTNALVRTVVD